MRERVGLLTGVADGLPWLGTFHAIGAKVLRRHAELVGLKSNFTILDTDDQLRLLKQILHAENIDDKRWPARAMAALIDGWKNRGLDPAHAPADEAAGFANGRGAAALPSLSGAAEDAQRRRFRRPAARGPAAVPRAGRCPGRVSTSLALSAGRRVPGHQRRPVPVAAPAGPGPPQPVLRGRRRPVHLRLARRRRRQHPALRTRLSRRDGDPTRAKLSLRRAYPGGRRRAHHPQSQPPRQDSLHRGRHGRKANGRRRVGQPGGGAGRRRRDRGGAARRRDAERNGDTGARLVPDARIRGAFHRAGHSLPGDRRPALLRAGRNPRRARLSALRRPARRRPRLRAHLQHAAARSRRGDAQSAARPIAAAPASR